MANGGSIRKVPSPVPPLDGIDNVVTVCTGWAGLERFLEAKGDAKNPRVTFWVRRPKGYVRAARSHLLPTLDLALLSKLSLQTDTNRASTALLKSLGLKLAR